MITVQKRQLTVEMVILTRGVEDVLFISMDGVSGLEEEAKAIFKDVVVQRCIVHLIRNSIKYIPSKDYKKFTEDLKKVYGEKVYKIAIDAGMTCPNRDGCVGTGGCIFCGDVGAAFENLPSTMEIGRQIYENMAYIGKKYKAKKFIAYFQSFTNTYASVNILRELYMEAISPDYIVGLSIGTRPDCLDDSKIKLLSQINKIKPVSVELGLQTIHKSTIDYIRRGYE